MSSEIFEERSDGVILKLKVKPSSEIFEIKEVDPWRNHLEVSVSSPPERGKANKELLDEFEKLLGKKVDLFSGHKSKEKKIFVYNCSSEKLKNKLDI